MLQQMKILFKMMPILYFLVLIQIALSFQIVNKQKYSPIQSSTQLDVVNYNETKAKQYAFISMITHCTDSQILKWNCQLCKNITLSDTSIVQNSTYDISGFVGYNKKTNQIVISWRGTIDAKNWEVDFKFNKVKYTPKNGTCKDCQIHAGIYQAYKSIQQQLIKQVNLLVSKYPGASISSTGHSLGGGLSLLSSLQLSIQYPSRLSPTYNFGCLRIGNSAFISFLHNKVPSIFRVVHYKDIVPHLPPTDFQYIHPAYEVLYDEQMKNFVVCNQSGEDKNCSDRYAPYFDPNDHTFYWVKTDSSVC